MFMNVGVTVAAPPGGRARHGSPGPAEPLTGQGARGPERPGGGPMIVRHRFTRSISGREKSDRWNLSFIGNMRAVRSAVHEPIPRYTDDSTAGTDREHRGCR